jgi:hypothetical protein
VLKSVLKEQTTALQTGLMTIRQKKKKKPEGARNNSSGELEFSNAAIATTVLLKSWLLLSFLAIHTLHHVPLHLTKAQAQNKQKRMIFPIAQCTETMNHSFSSSLHYKESYTSQSCGWSKHRSQPMS